MALKDKLLVRLTAGPRSQPEKVIAAGRHAAAAPVRARILLKAAVSPGGPGWGAAATAEALECSAGAVARVRKPLARGGLDAAVHRREPTGRRYRELDGAREARLVALACSAPPDGKARRTLKLPADRLAELEAVDAVSDEAGRRVLKRTRSSRGRGGSGSPRRRRTPSSSAPWGTCSGCTPARTTRGAR